jgi:mannitol-specific phosphotransferase system IIBC component
MEQKHIIITLATMIVVSVVASYGMVIQKWVDWTTTTLVDLDKRTAIMEVEAKHTNEMVAENHQMLKSLMKVVTEVSYGNGKSADGTTDINWQKAQND